MRARLSAFLVGATALASCTPQVGPSPVEDGAVVFPAQPFSAATLTCADGTRVVMDVRISSTALSFRIERAGSTTRLTAVGGPLIFIGSTAGARATLVFARDFGTVDLTYAFGAQQPAETSCR